MDFSEYQGNGKQYFDECLWLIVSQELVNKQTALTEQFNNCTDSDERKKIVQELSAATKALKERKLEEFYVR